MTRIAINGFGRIGRNSLRALLERGSDLEVVAVNDLTEPSALARLLAFDTTAGRLGRPVSTEGDSLEVDGHRIRVLAERDPAALPWGELDIDIDEQSSDACGEEGDERERDDRFGSAPPGGVEAAA